MPWYDVPVFSITKNTVNIFVQGGWKPIKMHLVITNLSKSNMLNTNQKQKYRAMSKLQSHNKIKTLKYDN